MRGVTLVDVLVVSAIIAVAATLTGVLPAPFLGGPPSKVRTAALGAATVKQAAELWINLDGAPDACPSLDDLVSSRKIDPAKIEDPWGSPYRITCDQDGAHVRSPGSDRKLYTRDDITDGMKPAEIEALERR